MALLQGLFSPYPASKLHRAPEAKATRLAVQPPAEHTYVPTEAFMHTHRIYTHTTVTVHCTYVYSVSSALTTELTKTLADKPFLGISHEYIETVAVRHGLHDLQRPSN